MKAYQLKIAINNSKPPIWRRCVVPSGITFSQLGVILNKVMGWSGYHLSQFEFYHLELQIMENAGRYEEYGFGKYDCAEASSTYIREYMEGNDWFTYIYDMGDSWKHRVTVEKISLDYPYNYPQVIKYKGACPMEDCGGIDGYYECLEIMSDESHPEHAERCEWAKFQQYEPEYDMEEVNRALKEECFLIMGKGDKRTGREIYEDFLDGKFGLKAAKSDRNKDTLRRSDRHRMEDSIKMMADLIKENAAALNLASDCDRTKLRQLIKDETAPTVRLRDIFSDFSREDLADIAESKGMYQISKYSKLRLADALAEEMLKPEEVEKYFLCIGTEELCAFEHGLEHDGIAKEGADPFQRLYQAGYIGIREDDLAVIPKDVGTVYLAIKTEEFEKNRRRLSALTDCFCAAPFLYGIVPAKIMTKLYEAAAGETIDSRKLVEMAGQIPDCFMELRYKNNMFYNRELYYDDRGLLKAQGDKSFYIPTEEEIRDLARVGCLPNDKYVKTFIAFLVKSMKADREGAEYAGIMIQHMISGDCRMQEVMDVLDECGIECRNEKDMERLVREIGELWNNTRMLLNRGYTPRELSAISPPRYDGQAAVQGDIIDLASRRQGKTKKIYPNDPCPCGSGKKYKNCCGKK